jgi:hypothetical protein
MQVRPGRKRSLDLVCQIEEEPVHSVVIRLRDERTEGNFDFETVLAALEELDEFSVHQRAPTAWQQVGGHLSAFAEFLPDFSKVEENGFLVARTRLVGRRIIAVQGASGPVGPLSEPTTAAQPWQREPLLMPLSSR